MSRKARSFIGWAAASVVVFGLGTATVLLHANSSGSDPDLRVGRNETVPSTPEARTGRLELVGAAPEQIVRVGWGVRVLFQLKNVGQLPVWVIPGRPEGPYPRCWAEIRDDEGKLQTIQGPVTACGFQNPLKPDSFQRLNPGEESSEQVDLFQWFWRYPKAGIYSVRMHFDSTSPDIIDWIGSCDSIEPLTRERLSLIPKVKLTSNTVRIVVEP